MLLSHCVGMGPVELCQVHKAAEMLILSPGKAHALTPMCMRTSEEQVNVAQAAVTNLAVLRQGVFVEE